MKKVFSDQTIGIILGIAILAVLIVVSPDDIRYRVPEGHRGLILSGLSGEVDKQNVIAPGRGLKLPWNYIEVYDVTEMSTTEGFDVLDKDANSLRITLTVRFSPIPDSIGYLRDTYGPDYRAIMIVPETRSAAREVMQSFSAEEVYSSRRREVEKMIREQARISFQRNYVRMEDVLIRSVELPARVWEAIEEQHRRKNKD